jgi:hypothetical protein
LEQNADAEPHVFGWFDRGPIERGDYEKVSAFLRLNHPYVGGFNLISTGGDIEEAMKIGRTLRRYLLSTVSSVRYHYENGERFEDEQPFLSDGVRDICRGETCICASACALIWIGGVNRLGMIGLHRQRTEEAGFRLLSPADASVLYHKVLDRMITYMEEMEAPQSIVDETIAAPSGDIRWVDVNEETSLYESPSIAEWIAASCGLEDPVQDARNPSRMIKQVICGYNLKLTSRARLDPP